MENGKDGKKKQPVTVRQALERLREMRREQKNALDYEVFNMAEAALRKYARLGVLVLALAIAAGVPMRAQEATTPAKAEALTEVQGLKGDVILLKIDSLDKQMRLLQAQYVGLQQQQTALVGELQKLEAEILKSWGYTPGEWAVNWAGKRAEKQPSRDREGADKKEDQDGSE